MLNKKRGMMAALSQAMPPMPEQPPSVHVQKAHKGGYIVRSHGKGAHGEETVHGTLASCIKHLKAHMGEAEKAEGEG